MVLGDDIVIFSPWLAEKYYDVMNTSFGVAIGLAKSIRSRGRLVLEFAKKYWVDGKRAFMLPIREVITANLSTAVLEEFIRKNELSFNSYLKMRGLGFRARSKVKARI